MTYDEEFVYKLSSEGIAYALVNYFSSNDINKINNKELKDACENAASKIKELEKILSRDFSHIEA